MTTKRKREAIPLFLILLILFVTLLILSLVYEFRKSTSIYATSPCLESSFVKTTTSLGERGKQLSGSLLPDMIAINTMGIGNATYFFHSYINKRNYAEKHGYKLFWWLKRLDESREPTWNKVPAILKIFKEHPQVQWVWSLDADAIITNSNITLQSIINQSLALVPKEKADQVDFIISKGSYMLNAGSFLLRRSEWSMNFLRETYEAGNDKEVPNIDWLMENAAIIHTLEKPAFEKDKHLAVVPQEMINSYPPDHCGKTWEPGHFLVHLAGLHSIKENFFKDFFADEVWV